MTADSGLLCHCPKDPEGHPPNTTGCASKIPMGHYAGFHHTNPDHSLMAAQIFTELAKHTTGPKRARYLQQASILRSAEREFRAQARCARAYHRVENAEEEAGQKPTKRQAEALARAREALPVALASARQLRWDNLL